MAEKKAPDTVQAQAEKADDMVHIRLFKDNERYKDDVFVAVNGKSWQIRRGEDVTVPRYVADVLEQSMKQDASTARLIERESNGFAAETKALGI